MCLLEESSQCLYFSGTEGKPEGKITLFMVFIGKAQTFFSHRRTRKKTGIQSWVIAKEERRHSTSKAAVMYPIMAYDKHAQNPMINSWIPELPYSSPSRKMPWSIFLLPFNLYSAFSKFIHYPRAWQRFLVLLKKAPHTQIQHQLRDCFLQALAALCESGMQTPTLHKRQSYNDPKHSQPMCTNTAHQYSMRKHGLWLPLLLES